MDAGLIWTIVGTAIGIVGFIFGTYESYKRRKLAEAVKALSQGYPGDVAKIHESCNWGWNNVRDAIQEISKMPNGEEKTKAITFISNAIGDTAAGLRMSINLFNQLLTFQKAQFGTREIDHPQSATLPLCKAEAESQKMVAANRAPIKSPWWKFRSKT